MNRLVPLILAVAFFMEMMDSTVIATALPAIATDIGVNPITLKLALTAYLVALAIFIPVSGWMADRFGAKQVFSTAIGVFIIGSIMCAFSGSLGAFVVSRFIQGMGGSMMMPVGRLVLVRSFKKKELVSAMALLAVPGLIGPMAGPPLGGFITTYFSWHLIFWINVPIGLMGITMSMIYLPEIAKEDNKAIDWIGFVLSGIAASGVVFGLSVISLPALPPIFGVFTTLLGVASGFAYVFHAKRTPNPLLNLDIFRNETFRIAQIGGTIYRVANGALPFLLPLMLQLGFGMTPFQAGMITFAGAGGAITTKFVASRTIRHFGFPTVMIVAAIAGAITTISAGFFTSHTPIALMIAILAFSGFSRSFLFTSINSLSFADIENNQTSQASAISSVLQQIAMALGVALAGFILETGSWLSGEALSLTDFHAAFYIVGTLSLMSIWQFARLKPDAGAEVSGHIAKPV